MIDLFTEVRGNVYHFGIIFFFGIRYFNVLSLGIRNLGKLSSGFRDQNPSCPPSFQLERLHLDLTATLQRSHYDHHIFTATQPCFYYDYITFVQRCSRLKYDSNTLMPSRSRFSYDVTTFILVRPFKVLVMCIVFVTY